LCGGGGIPRTRDECAYGGNKVMRVRGGESSLRGTVGG